MQKISIIPKFSCIFKIKAVILHRISNKEPSANYRMLTVLYLCISAWLGSQRDSGCGSWHRSKSGSRCGSGSSFFGNYWFERKALVA